MFTTVNQYCLQRIVRLSESRQVVATENIVAVSGMKLWAEGMPMPADVQQRLLQHKLTRPLELALAVEQGVALPDIVNTSLEQMEESPLLLCLAGTPAAQAMLRTLGKVQLPPPVRLLLTAVREHDASEYQSNLNTLLVSAGIAARLKLAEREATTFLLAALLHDFGLLYLNPELQDKQQQLEPAQWKCLAAHPVIGQMIVRELTSLPALVGECVAQHHERLDGSGYPNYLTASRTHRLGAWLAVADSVSAIMARGGDDVAARVCLALKIVPEEFDREAAGVVIQSLRDQPSNLDCQELNGHALAVDAMARLDHALEVVSRCRNKTMAAESSGVVNSLIMRLENMVKSMRATGVLDVAAQIKDLMELPELLGEISGINHEIAWRMRSAARNARLRAEGNASLLEDLQEAIDVLNGAEMMLPIAA